MASSNDDGDALVRGAISLILFTFLGLGLVWLVFGRQISSGYQALRSYELLPFSLLPGAAALRAKLATLNGTPMGLWDTVVMLFQTGLYTSWLFVPVIFGGAAYLYTHAPRHRFSRRYTMQELVRSQVGVWPALTPIVGKHADLLKNCGPGQGDMPVSMTALEFANQERLFTEGGALDRDAAQAVFERQLGARWSGVASLPAHTKALFAAFLLQAHAKSDDCVALLNRLSVSSVTDHLDMTGVDEALQKYAQSDLAKRIYKHHAYVFTVMATTLQVAQARGVLNTALFIWLKPRDRRLFYTLNCVGRKAFFVECAGVMAHWLFEKSVRRAVTVPMVSKAVFGLIVELAKYKEDDSAERIFD